VSSLWNGKKAQKLAALAEYGQKRPLPSVRGVAFLIVGLFPKSFKSVAEVVEYILHLSEA
jgi:hypothetical protein